MLRIAAALFVATTVAKHESPTQKGVDEAILLLRSATWLAAARGQTASGAAVRSIRVAANSTVFVGYENGIEKFDFSDSIRPRVQQLGEVPREARGWSFLQTACTWIHADVTFNFSAQQTLLAEDARCFGITGREAIIQSSREGERTIAYRLVWIAKAKRLSNFHAAVLFPSANCSIPYTITLDLDNEMVSFDYDKINRTVDTVVGRGTGG